MNLLSWLTDKLGKKAVPVNFNEKEYFDEYASLVFDVYVREMAFWSAVNLIANAVSKCEFKTYFEGKETKGKEYYLWNIEPNKNQNSSQFLSKLIAKLYRENECLVVESGGQLLVADSFSRKPYALYDDIFTEVQVGDFTFSRSFEQSDVLYFKLHEEKIRTLVNGLYDSYSKLIAYSMKSYQRSKGTKGIFKYNTLPTAGTEQREIFDKLINERIGKWLNSDSAALPLGDGQDWQELQQKTYSSENTRDIRAQIDDVFIFTARALGIPPALLTGDVQDTSKAVDQLLTFCVDPLVDTLQEEIIRKRIGRKGFEKGIFLKIDTKSIKHVDLLSVATAVDKLIGSGCFTVNDIRKAVGDEPIDEPWADQHFITKNYETIEAALKALEGGESD